jgi:hypothetical protein
MRLDDVMMIVEVFEIVEGDAGWHKATITC